MQVKEKNIATCMTRCIAWYMSSKEIDWKKKETEVPKRTLLALPKCTLEWNLAGGLLKVSTNCNYQIFGVRSVKGSSNNVRIAIKRV